VIPSSDLQILTFHFKRFTLHAKALSGFCRGDYICIKAITLGERKKEKDAYDIFFCIDNFPGGPRALAREFLAIIGDPLVAEGISVLREKFARLDGVGPVWAALVAAGGDCENVEVMQNWQRRAFEIVNGLLRGLDGFAPP